MYKFYVLTPNYLREKVWRPPLPGPLLQRRRGRSARSARRWARSSRRDDPTNCASSDDAGCTDAGLRAAALRERASPTTAVTDETVLDNLLRTTHAPDI